MFTKNYFYPLNHLFVKDKEKNSEIKYYLIERDSACRNNIADITENYFGNLSFPKYLGIAGK